MAGRIGKERERGPFERKQGQPSFPSLAFAARLRTNTARHGRKEGRKAEGVGNDSRSSDGGGGNSNSNSSSSEQQQQSRRVCAPQATTEYALLPLLLAFFFSFSSALVVV